MSLQIDSTEDNGAYIFTLSGDLDAGSVPALRQSLETSMRDRTASIILDFNAVEFLDSTGIGAVIQAHKQISKMGGTFKLMHMKGQPLQTFTFLKLNHLIDST